MSLSLRWTVNGREGGEYRDYLLQSISKREKNVPDLQLRQRGYTYRFYNERH